ncbi:AAA family ATPase [Spirosoma sp. HMF4905]|uniref:AAA family ATPase n=1 Tax=Spirosoma arboris TaxID=2682092 RepID=A0A7K1SK21_9BACT|nr:MoxR family ATPase [Spirosoma arboris]MVM34159.1 AAA family ATPase [Spirosoma arboris]
MPLTLRTIPVDLKPSNYLMDSRLQRAVELAYALNKPLLVSGEPGTGKTQLAWHIADILAKQTEGTQAPFLNEPIEFYTKSTSTATDLFYTYDAVSHFRSKEQTDTNAFVDFTALGRARVLAHGRNSPALLAANIQPLLDRCDRLTTTPRSSVVLIDEIDKAPREFPNDLLNEMESGEFRVRELNFSLKKPQNDARVVVILTSNFEKSLPNAFLRRCVFYHIPFPSDDQLLEIVNLRLGLSQSPAVSEALRRFRSFRDQARQSSSRVPSTAEFLDWLRVLNADKLLIDNTFPPLHTHSSRALYESSLVVLQKDGAAFDKNNPLLA